MGLLHVVAIPETRLAKLGRDWSDFLTRKKRVGSNPVPVVIAEQRDRIPFSILLPRKLFGPGESAIFYAQMQKRHRSQMWRLTDLLKTIALASTNHRAIFPYEVVLSAGARIASQRPMLAGLIFAHRARLIAAPTIRRNIELR